MDHVDITITEHLKLKSWHISEAAELFALVDANRDHLSKWLPWVSSVKTVVDSTKFIEDAIRAMQQDDGLELGIWYNEKLVGCIGLHELDTLHKKTSLGYWLGHNAVGKGNMTKAVKALTTYCFEELQLNRVELRAATENEKSAAIAKKLWFKKEGILRQAEFINGEFVDDTVYSMLKKDWIPSRV